MKKFLLSGSLTLLLLPGLALAAFNDVSLTTATIITAGGVTLTITGSSATIQSVAVSSTVVTFVLLSGSSAKVASAAGNKLATNADATYISTDTCTGGVSTLGLTSSSATVTITVTPDSSQSCSGAATRGANDTVAAAASTNSNGAPAGGGGGGGGGSYSPSTTPAPTAPGQPAVTTGTTGTTGTIAALQAQLNALLAQLATMTGGTASGSFSRDLQVGAKGDDVMTLQVYLNKHGFVVAKSGAGSKGNETTKFGAATKAALKKLQKAAGISPASGNFGPKTRAYIATHP